MNQHQAIRTLIATKESAPRGCRHATLKTLLSHDDYLEFIGAIEALVPSSVVKYNFYDDELTVANFVNYLLKLVDNRKY